MTDQEFELAPESAEAVITLAGCALALGLAAAVDARIDPESETQARGWHLMLGDTRDGYRLRAGDVMAAVVEHYQHSAERIMPAHVIAIVEGWREQWVMGHTGPMPLGGRVPPDALVSGPELAALQRRGRRELNGGSA